MKKISVASAGLLLAIACTAASAAQFGDVTVRALSVGDLESLLARPLLP